MSIVSEVKCPRCDRRYSGIRGRCPYCGARRMGRGKHSTGGENSKGKIIIGLLLMAVLIVAVVVLLVSSLNGDPKEPEETISPPPTDDSVNKVTGPSVSPPPSSPSPSPSGGQSPPPTVEQVVQDVIITYIGSKKEDITLKIGESVPLKAKVTPDNLEDVRVEWSSSNEAIFTVTPESGLITGISTGEADLTVTAGDKTAVCKIRVSTERFNG